MGLVEFARGPAFLILAYQTPDGRVPVDEYLESLTPVERNRLLNRIGFAANVGPTRNEEQSKSVAGERFFEFKAGAQRVFWMYAPKRRIVLLHGFTKKSSRTSRLDLEVGRARYNNAIAEIGESS